MVSRLLAFLLLLFPGLLVAEEALHPRAPLSESPTALGASLSLGGASENWLAAERALGLGLPSLAANLLEPLLAFKASELPLERSELVLTYVSARMEEGQLEVAEKALEGLPEPRASPWHLRKALLAVLNRQLDQARLSAAQCKWEELKGFERPWWHFLQGLLADTVGDFEKGRDAYNLALRDAETDLARARFALAREQAFLRRGVVNLETLRANTERFLGQKVGYGAAKQYAVGLNAVGQRSEAVRVLQRLLQSLPASEAREIDEVRLLLGLVDGAEASSTGRNALFRLLESGFDVERQRMALVLLAKASSTPLALAELRAKLDALIRRTSAPAILDQLYLTRATLALSARDFASAEADAKALIDRFPGSTLTTLALGTLTHASWEQRRYRSAADFASRAVNTLSAGPLQATFRLVVAEAWYRAGDFINAADAYAQVIEAPPPGLAVGTLFFQRIQAEIDAGRPDLAQVHLDRLAGLPSFDVENRWHAEWNLARYLQANEQTDRAFQRVASLLSTPLPGEPSLVARMRWLQAKLAVDSQRFLEALGMVEQVDPMVQGLEEPLKGQVTSSLLLLRAQAELGLSRPEAALATLQGLRAGFPKSDSAIYSIVIEADYFVARDRIVDAQQRLIGLADEYRESSYAPFALYRAALLAERRGQNPNFEEANRLLEQLVSRYPASDLVFHARLRQGDLLRRLNEFALAERAYDYLVKNFALHPDVLAARLALADCHAAQALQNPAHGDRALELYEALVARPDATVDMRIEAGYKLGAAYRRRNDARRASEVWWRDVVGEYLEKKEKSAQLGSRGRSWLVRTLFDLAEVLDRSGKADEARRVWLMVLESKLTPASVELARTRLQAVGAYPAEPTIPSPSQP